MNSRQITKNIAVADDSGRERIFQLEKFTALTGIKLGKFFISKLLPIAQEALPALKEMNQDSDNAKITDKSSFNNILDNIDLSQVANVLETLSDDDLEKIAYMCLTNVSESLPAQFTSVINKQSKAYQIQDIEYDPVLFIKLIYEQLKFGLSDFFKGNRWASLFRIEGAADFPE